MIYLDLIWENLASSSVRDPISNYLIMLIELFTVPLVAKASTVGGITTVLIEQGYFEFTQLNCTPLIYSKLSLKLRYY